MHLCSNDPEEHCDRKSSEKDSDEDADEDCEYVRMVKLIVGVAKSCGETVYCISRLDNPYPVTDLESLGRSGEKFHSSAVDSCRIDAEFTAKAQL